MRVKEESETDGELKSLEVLLREVRRDAGMAV